MDNERIEEENNEQAFVPAKEDAGTDTSITEQVAPAAVISDCPPSDPVGYTERESIRGSGERSDEDRSEKPKHKSSKAFTIMTMALIACICFSAFQTVYIFGLTTGKFGNMTYTNGRKQENKPVAQQLSVRPSDLADPAFTLEEAASVYDPNKDTLSTVEIVDKVSPATVSVFIVDTTDGSSEAVSSGSGFIISEDGYVVTNQHVVEDATKNDNYELKVVVPDYEDPISAQVVGADVQTDVAVLKLDSEESFPYVTLGDSDLLQTGELVVVIGNPLGTLSGSVTAGVVSALGRTMNNKGYTLSLIQTDASINVGNSGGPMINSFGEVIGITNAKMSSAEGLGFAIPISDVKSIIQSLINYGYVANRPYLGVSVSYVADGSFYGAFEGVFVAEVDAGGPAEEAGIQVGDRIISMDGIEITATNDIIDIRNSHEIGDYITVVIERNNKEIELSLRVGDSYTGK